MPLIHFALIAFAVLACAAPAVAQEDEEGSKDHPMFSRMPGYFISAYDAQDFGSFDFDVGQGDTKHVEGKYWRIGYEIKEGQKKVGPLQIGRNYTDLMVKRGGKRLWEEFEANFGETTATMPAGGHTIWLQVVVPNNSPNYDLIIVEEAAMKQDVEFNAAQLAEELKSKGSVAVHSLLFDTGKATIKPESANTLSVIGHVLKTDPSLKLEIQGHTDNVGGAAANRKLSQERATAVKSYLVQTSGIAADRLTTSGFGDTKPVAPNTTEEGRAQNRRVELVKK